MKKDDWAAIGIIVAVVLILTICLSQPYLEARAFNKFKSEDTPKASYLDAVVSRLRITSK